MNCHEIESVIRELSNDGMMDAATRKEALAHASKCSRCTLRLSEERSLSVGLRSLARTSTDEAPARVEASVLSFFREFNSGLADRPLPARPARARRLIYAAVGIAAAVVIVVLVSLAVSRGRTSPSPEQAKGIDAPRQTASGHPSEQAVPQTKNERVSPARTPLQSRKARFSDQRAAVRRERDASPHTPVATEIATDFIPLMHGDSLTQVDGGQVVRVELPRSALVRFGLPMNIERADERIKADVVVGNDGLARAIRFVR